MANLQHKDIPDPERHEPKNISTATVNQLYVANGAGSGTWQKIANSQLNLAGTLRHTALSDGAGGFLFEEAPHGRISFVDIATPYTLVFPATYTKVAPTTVASGMGSSFTEGTNARLTYTGATTQHFHIALTISASQAAGANRDIRFAVSKNGALITSSETIQTTTSAIKVSTAIHADEMLSTGDYLEVIAKNDGASGDITVYGVYLFAMGLYK